MSFLRQRRPFKLTKGGWIFILYTIGVGAGAINTGNNLLYLVFGLFLGLILASGVLSDLTLWGLEAAPIAPQEGRVGEPLLYPISVHNSKSWFPSLGVRVDVRGELNGKPVQATAFCAAIAASAHRDVLPVFHPQARGQLIVTDVTFSTRFPFGLLFKSWTRRVPALSETFISPKLLTKDPDVPVSVMVGTDQMALRRGEGPTLFGIREFQPADNPRRIHWKASAKRAGGWLVREMEEEQSESVRLLWPDPFPALSESDLELFVSYAATLMETVESRRRRVVMVGKEGDWLWSLEGDRVKRFLALVRPGYFPENADTVHDSADAADLYAAFQSEFKRGRSA